MRRSVSVLLLAAVLILTAAGCASREKPFLGKWSYDFGGGNLGMYYIFEEKGVLKAQTLLGEANGKPALDFGAYKVVDGGTILLTDTLGEEKEYAYVFTGDGTNLTISDEEYIMSFTKVLPEK